jgi:hypothetical protein
MQEKVYDESSCLWRQKSLCSFEKKAIEDKLLGDFKCDKDCDFSTLKFEKDAILERITYERHQIRKAYLFARDRKKKDMLDKCVGISKMFESLEEHFGMNNPLKDSLNVAMTDIDRIKSIIGGLI